MCDFSLRRESESGWLLVEIRNRRIEVDLMDVVGLSN